MVEDSILTSTKKVLGIAEDYDHFDVDIVMHINSIFATLHQLGVGPQTDAFQISDKTEVWKSFTNDSTLASVQSYMWAAVRLAFDPPTTSYSIEALEKIKSEFEYRLMFRAEEVKRGTKV